MASVSITCLLIFIPFVVFSIANAANFHVLNSCTYTVWAAVIPGGGKQLNPGESWDVDVPAGTTGGRLWGRTGCSFNSTGQGSCQTGDCSGVLNCTTYGKPPNTLAEFALKQFSNLDFYDISLVDGFNIPMDYRPTNSNCHGVACKRDINGECPAELRAPGGCNNPCTVFKNDLYCCTSSHCTTTNYTQFFRQRCPDAYPYSNPDAASTTVCPSGTTDYKVIFCP